MEKYVDYVKNFIKDNLPNLENETKYACDLGYYITECINVKGYATYNKQEAMQYIKEWFDEAAEVYEYEMENFGKVYHNPFKDPKAWMVCMIIEGVNAILCRCNVLEKCWNEEIVLTVDVIDSILAEVEKVEKIEF